MPQHLPPDSSGAQAAAARPSGFLDAVGGSPLHPAALDALVAAWSGASAGAWADARALHDQGRRASRIRAAALASIADVLLVRPDELRLASSGDAARRAAVRGVATGRRRAGSTVVVSAVESSSLLDAADAVGAATVVSVDRTGRVLLDAWATAVRGPGVCVAVLQAGNQESATLQPVAEAAAIARDAGVPLVVDLGASLGRAPVPAGAGDVLVADAAAWGGGTAGVVAVRTGVRFDLDGSGLNPAALDPSVPELAAAAAALLAAEAERPALSSAWTGWDARIRQALRAIPDTDIAGPEDPGQRLPGILSASFLYLDGEALVGALNAVGLSVASGSACTAEDRSPSHVLAAMGLLTQGNLRVSLGRWTSDDDVDRLVTALPPIVARARERAGMTDG